MKFGEKIRKIRSLRRWNQEKLAIQAGISRATVYNAEATTWHWEVQQKTLKGLADAFEIDINSLISDAAGDPVKEPDVWDAFRLPEKTFGPTAERQPEYGICPAGKAKLSNELAAIQDTNAAEIEQMAAVATWFARLSRPNQMRLYGMIRDHLRKAQKPRKTA